MRYFPLKLKIRSPGADAISHGDIIYQERKDLEAGTPRPSLGKADGAQVEFSRIVQKLDSGGERRGCAAPSYIMKYILKTLPANGNKVSNKPNSQRNNDDSSNDVGIARVDAFRSIWGINQGQLFGVAKCLTAWDEIRRLQQAPSHPKLKDLWIKARGGDAEGRIEKCSGQRGDAHAFLEALGGLDAARNGRRSGKWLAIGRLVKTALNQYGDVIKRTIGIRLLQKDSKRVKKKGGESLSERRVHKTLTKIIVSVITKLEVWEFERKKSDRFTMHGKPILKPIT
jgi:hypothetical protein